ncbi:MAG: glycosyltransferase family 2 protein [Verrucomicrobiales bacterium]|nr:glycosyltransferase family 2 protein [Verrucomicrobiales bacterium]MCP5559051.1 glycosyltransferase family 2 protein [Verrucomicrobiaceae bacterium]
MCCPSVTFTVYTPTFNRAHTLHRAYESLKQQTFRDFEWLIVDDGSTDETATLIKTWQQENLVPIRYFPRPHRGAHVAHNVGVNQSKGELLIKLDSDDACVPETLATLHRAWTGIPQEKRGGFAGVTVLCKDEKGLLVGNRFPHNPLDCSSQELEYKYRVKGEKWGCVRTDILRTVPFPEDVPGNFIPESFIWSQIGRKYLTRHVNEVLRIYWTDAPSLVHGRPNPFTNAAGHRLMFLAILNNEISWFASAPLRLFRAAAQFARFGWLSGMKLSAQNEALSGWKQRLLWLAALPAAQIMVWRDQRRQAA